MQVVPLLKDCAIIVLLTYCGKNV